MKLDIDILSKIGKQFYMAVTPLQENQIMKITASLMTATISTLLVASVSVVLVVRVHLGEAP